MGSQLSNTFKVTYSGLFIFAFVFVMLNIDTPRLFDFTKLLSLLDYLLVILMLILSFLGSIIASIIMTIGSVIGSHDIIIPFTNIVIFNFHVNPPPANADYGATLNNILIALFPRSQHLFTGDFNTIIVNFIQVWAIAVAFVLLPAILLSTYGFIRYGESRLAITSFVTLQILIILAMYTPDPYTVTGRMMLVDLSLPVFGGTLSSLVPDFMALITRPIFLLGISLYLLLEVAFQTSYAISVVDPMIEREKRIKKHLQRIDNFQPQPEKDKKQSVSSIKSASKKYDILAASYLREMVDRRIFKRGQQLDQKTTMRLQSFLGNLRRIDRQFENKITAKSAQPDTRALLFNAIPSIAIRAITVIILSFIIIDPNWLINLFISSPLQTGNVVGLINFPQLADSLELNQPEFRTVLVFNIVLLILFVSAVGHWLLVHKPESQQVQVQKIETLVDFKDVQASPIIEEEETGEV